MSEKKEFEPLDVGATERVDWKVAQGLNKYVHFDENGNAVIGKNLEIGGTTKLNGGIEPIHEYNLNNGYKLQILFEEQDLPAGDNAFTGIGFLISDDDSATSCLANYKVENGNIVGDSFNAIDCVGNTYHLTQDSLNITNILDELNFKQKQLYTHTLTLTADKSYTLIYSSIYEFHINTIAELRSMMNVTATNDNVILPVCATDLSGTAALQVTTTLCKIGTANVTTVSDKVTSL